MERKMIVCGVELTGPDSILTILDGEKSNFICKNVLPKKIKMIDDENSVELKAYQDNIYAFFRENRIEKIAIKKRAKKGQFSGGPIGFKMETIIQLFSETEVILISPQAIAAAERNNTPTIPNFLNVYQESAFWTAFTALP